MKTEEFKCNDCKDTGLIEAEVLWRGRYCPEMKQFVYDTIGSGKIFMIQCNCVGEEEEDK